MIHNFEDRYLNVVSAYTKYRKQNSFIVEKKNAKRRGKYNAQPTVVDGIRFDSKIESIYYGKLVIREAAKEITDLVIHPSFQITLNEIPICIVELDFEFLDLFEGRRRYIDVKGMDTPVSKLKRKLVEAQFRIKVEVI